MSAGERAVLSIARWLDRNRRFPYNVFREPATYAFFDSDWLFDVEFLGVANALLRREGGECASFIHLDREAAGDRDARFLISERTSAEAYREVLAGPAPGFGWVYEMGRFVCSSDAGQWCIYCERGAEIAVVAIRADVPRDRFDEPLSSVHAESLTEALAGPLSYGFSSSALTPEWRSKLLEQYGAPLS